MVSHNISLFTVSPLAQQVGWRGADSLRAFPFSLLFVDRIAAVTDYFSVGRQM